MGDPPADPEGGQAPPKPKTRLVQQVFISFAAIDDGARKYAVNVVKPALQRAGLEVILFGAEEKAEVTAYWTPTVQQAAADSAALVAIFSEQYTSRYWCMRELELALNGYEDLEREQPPTVIPLYYKTSPPFSGDTEGWIDKLWRPDYTQPKMDKDKWAASLRAIVGNPSVHLTDDTAAAQQAATKQVVKLAVEAVFKVKSTAYNLPHVARFAAEAAVPADREVGVLLQDAAGTLTMPQLAATLPPKDCLATVAGSCLSTTWHRLASGLRHLVTVHTTIHSIARGCTVSGHVRCCARHLPEHPLT